MEEPPKIQETAPVKEEAKLESSISEKSVNSFQNKSLPKQENAFSTV